MLTVVCPLCPQAVRALSAIVRASVACTPATQAAIERAVGDGCIERVSEIACGCLDSEAPGFRDVGFLVRNLRFNLYTPQQRLLATAASVERSPVFRVCFPRVRGGAQDTAVDALHGIIVTQSSSEAKCRARHCAGAPIVRCRGSCVRRLCAAFRAHICLSSSVPLAPPGYSAPELLTLLRATAAEHHASAGPASRGAAALLGSGAAPPGGGPVPGWLTGDGGGGGGSFYAAAAAPPPPPVAAKPSRAGGLFSRVSAKALSLYQSGLGGVRAPPAPPPQLPPPPPAALSLSASAASPLAPGELPAVVKCQEITRAVWHRGSLPADIGSAAAAASGAVQQPAPPAGRPSHADFRAGADGGKNRRNSVSGVPAVDQKLRQIAKTWQGRASMTAAAAAAGAVGKQQHPQQPHQQPLSPRAPHAPPPRSSAAALHHPHAPRPSAAAASSFHQNDTTTSDRGGGGGGGGGDEPRESSVTLTASPPNWPHAPIATATPSFGGLGLFSAPPPHLAHASAGPTAAHPARHPPGTHLVPGVGGDRGGTEEAAAQSGASPPHEHNKSLRSRASLASALSGGARGGGVAAAHALAAGGGAGKRTSRGGNTTPNSQSPASSFHSGLPLPSQLASGGGGGVSGGGTAAAAAPDGPQQPHAPPKRNSMLAAAAAGIRGLTAEAAAPSSFAAARQMLLSEAAAVSATAEERQLETGQSLSRPRHLPLVPTLHYSSAPGVEAASTSSPGGGDEGGPVAAKRASSNAASSHSSPASSPRNRFSLSRAASGAALAGSAGESSPRSRAAAGGGVLHWSRCASLEGQAAPPPQLARASNSSGFRRRSSGGGADELASAAASAGRRNSGDTRRSSLDDERTGATTTASRPNRLGIGPAASSGAPVTGGGGGAAQTPRQSRASFVSFAPSVATSSSAASLPPCPSPFPTQRSADSGASPDAVWQRSSPGIPAAGSGRLPVKSSFRRSSSLETPRSGGGGGSNPRSPFFASSSATSSGGRGSASFHRSSGDVGADSSSSHAAGGGGGLVGVPQQSAPPAEDPRIAAVKAVSKTLAARDAAVDPDFLKWALTG